MFDGTPRSYLKSTLHFLIIVIIVAALVRLFVVVPGRVDGVSMEPTFYDGQAFLVSRLDYFFRTPERHDIVQLIDPTADQKLLIKRIIALPGETLEFENNQITITPIEGEPFVLDEPYLKPTTLTRRGAYEGIKVPISDDSYFVMGDNRLSSKDSREFGAIHRQFLNGKVYTIESVLAR
ncbi:signal peptidase I [Candidatus Peregrinibacteria bacterium CG_4_9_14_0_2_um_filter_53_11]|nr:MAG: signal peptidase I [Candidatus Peregrinibacteria bacterium CG_4_9_14_0_2_um_filter_53_11]